MRNQRLRGSKRSSMAGSRLVFVLLLIGLEGGVVFRNQYQSKVINVIKAKSMQS